MLKTKFFRTITVNDLTYKKKKKKKKPNWLSIKKKFIYLFILFLCLLLNDCILIYLKTTILSIFKFLKLYGCVFGFFFPLYSSPR